MLLHYFGVDGSESTMTRLLSKMTSKTLEMMAEYIWSRSDFRGWNKIGNCPEKIEPRAQHHRIKCSRYFLFYNVQENGRTVLPHYSFLKAEVILFESVVLNYTHFFSSFFFLCLGMVFSFRPFFRGKNTMENSWFVFVSIKQNFGALGPNSDVVV